MLKFIKKLLVIKYSDEEQLELFCSYIKGINDVCDNIKREGEHI